MAILLGVLKGSWLSNQWESYLWPQCWKDLPVKVRPSSRNENKSSSACICPGGLYLDFILIYIFDDTHIYISGLQNIPKFPIATNIIHLWNRNLLLKMWASLHFSALFPFQGQVCVVYICLVFGVVIFDELWVVTDIDVLVNTVHDPDFDDTKINPASLLIYSEHRIADIHSKTVELIVRVIYFISARGSPCLITSERWSFFSSLSEGSNRLIVFLIRDSL